MELVDAEEPWRDEPLGLEGGEVGGGGGDEGGESVESSGLAGMLAAADPMS